MGITEQTRYSNKTEESKQEIQISFASNEVNSQSKTVKISGIQKAMTKSMTKATQIPSFLYTDEINASKLIRLREQANNSLRTNIKLSYMPFFLKAVSLALREFPILNSTTDDSKDEDGLITQYIMHSDHNISIAIDTPQGLLVPNIKNVNKLSIVEIQNALNSLRERALKKKLTGDDFNGGTFSVSNIGNIGGKVLNPVIYPNQVSIMAISGMFDSLKLVNRLDEKSKGPDEQTIMYFEKDNSKGVQFHKALNICISSDHRIIDGATVARFSAHVRSLLEEPMNIILNN